MSRRSTKTRRTGTVYVDGVSVRAMEGGPAGVSGTQTRPEDRQGGEEGEGEDWAAECTRPWFSVKYLTSQPTVRERERSSFQTKRDRGRLPKVKRMASVSSGKEARVIGSVTRQLRERRTEGRQRSAWFTVEQLMRREIMLLRLVSSLRPFLC